MLDTSKLTSSQLYVLGDMLDEWLDKDRHGELRGQRDYDDDDVDAVYEIYAAVREASGY